MALWKTQNSPRNEPIINPKASSRTNTGTFIQIGLWVQKVIGQQS